MRTFFSTPLLLLAGLLLAGQARAQRFDPIAPPAPSGPPAIHRTVLSTNALQPGQQGAVAVVLDMQPGYHAQSHKPLDENLIPLRVAMADHPFIRWYEPVYPEGEIHDYPQLGRLSVYTGQVIVYVPFQVKADAPAAAIRLTGELTYQICDDKACLPPESPAIGAETSIVPAGHTIAPNEPGLFRDFDATIFSRLIPVVRKTQLGLFGWELSDDAWVFAFTVAFLVGIIFNLMPCVLPVVPLKAISFYEVSQHHRLKSILLGAVFSLGIIASFAVLALLVVVYQKISWGQQFSNPWFLAAIILILVVMAFGMFGAFSVLLPPSVYSLAPRHDTYTGNFLFGILAAVLSTPCTAPMFLGLLIWATRQPPVIGTALVMTVGVGMAFPYLILSAFPELARRFPRSGPWAELVKQLMGFLLLGVAVYFARPFIERWLNGDAFWWTIFGVVAAGAAFLVVRTMQFSSRLLPRALAVTVALLLTAPALAWTMRQTHHPIDWQPYSPEALAAAQASGRPVLVEFTAAWCANCQWLEAYVLHSDEVVEAIKRHEVVALKADVTHNHAVGWGLLREVNPVGAIPLTVIYSPALQEPIQLSGVYTAAHLLAALERAADRSAIAAR